MLKYFDNKNKINNNQIDLKYQIGMIFYVDT